MAKNRNKGGSGDGMDAASGEEGTDIENEEDEAEAEAEPEEVLAISAHEASLPDDFLPEGFEQLGAEQAPFILKAPGVIVSGILIDRFLRKKATGKGSPYFYQIRVDRKVRGVLGSKKDGTQRKVWVEPGGLISIDESESMKDLAAICNGDGRHFKVYIRYLRKMDLSNGNSFWQIKKGFQEIKEPSQNGSPVSRSPNARGLGEVNP